MRTIASESRKTRFALAAYAAEPSHAPESERRDALDALMDWANPSRRDRILNIFRPLPPRGVADAVAAITPVIPALLKNSPGGVPGGSRQTDCRSSRFRAPGDSPLFALATARQSGRERPRRGDRNTGFAEGQAPRAKSPAPRAVISSRMPKSAPPGLKALANGDSATSRKVDCCDH